VIRPGRRAALALTILATVAADRLSKEAAARLLSGRPPVELLGGSIRFALAENRGAFLSLGGKLPESLRFTLLVAALGLLLLGALAALLRQRSWPARRAYAAAVMLGGGLANWLDRLADGAVTDFLVLRAGPLHTGVFNLADAAILAGALAWLVPTRTGRPERSPSSGA
jgi:signal peptidase II